MKRNLTLLLTLLFFSLHSQTSSIKGQLQDADDNAVVYANVALYNAADSSMAKVETSDESGIFKILNIPSGKYWLQATYVGVSDLKKEDIEITDNQEVDLGVLKFSPAAVQLEQATVTATRAIVEVKADRTVFNVEGTVNSTGADGLALLRKAPGVTLDNNNNVSVLGRTGVRIFIDGKPTPLSGDDLTNYLQSLQANQIDRIDIITNPGAKYEAEGNAGIIDIRLKKDKNHGSNGSANLTFGKGRYWRVAPNISGNYRNSKMNLFGSAAYGTGKSYHDMIFLNTMNGIYQEEINETDRTFNDYNLRIGADFFLTKNATLGFLVNGGENQGQALGFNDITLAPATDKSAIDSILVANNENNTDRTRGTFNVNYRFDNRKSGQVFNIDLDYGLYRGESDSYQPNLYYDAARQNVLTEVINSFDTPSDIDIYTAKVDYEQNALGGKIGFGSKFSKVVSNNTFLYFDELAGQPIQNDTFSNIFKYDENVLAGYVTYNRKLNQKWNMSLGLRAEQTDAQGDLSVFASHLSDSTNNLSYLQWFPSAGLSWTPARTHSFNLAFGRRINRPDYQVLNPFNTRLSELSYEKGNPRLNPEIVNNVELGYTWKYMYNFKLSYSRTFDQITRLIAPDLLLDENGDPVNPDSEGDARAGFITYDNLATQTIYNFNISAPIQFNKWWSAFFNAGIAYQDNQADYGFGRVVDVQAIPYNIFQQHTFTLGNGFKGEVSGWYSGPGVWGGVFEYGETWSLDLGLQRKFFYDKLNVRLSMSDLFYKTGWNGFSEYAGLLSEGRGNWDSRRFSVSLNYNFGNQNVKSRKRKTGLEDESKRLGN